MRDHLNQIGNSGIIIHMSDTKQMTLMTKIHKEVNMHRQPLLVIDAVQGCHMDGWGQGWWILGRLWLGGIIASTHNYCTGRSPCLHGQNNPSAQTCGIYVDANIHPLGRVAFAQTENVFVWTHPCRREYPFARTGRNCADGLRSHGWRMRPCRRVVPARTYTSVHEEASICQILSLRMGRIHVDGECICMDVDAWTQSVPTETSFSLYGHHPSM